VAANTPPAVHPSPPPVAQPSPQSGPCTESQLGLTTTTTNGSTFTQYSGTDAQIALTATNHSGAQCSDFLNTCMRDYLKIFDAQGNLVYDSRNDTTNSCSNTDVAVTLAPGQSYTLNFTWKPGSCDQPACPLETYPQNFEAQGFWENWPSTQAKITVN
jgi:hypothetical protein